MNRARLNQWVEVKAGFTVDDRTFLPATRTVTVTDPAGATSTLTLNLVGTYYSGQLQLTKEGTWTIVSRGVGQYQDGNGQLRDFDENTTQVVTVV